MFPAREARYDDGATGLRPPASNIPYHSWVQYSWLTRTHEPDRRGRGRDHHCGTQRRLFPDPLWGKEWRNRTSAIISNVCTPSANIQSGIASAGIEQAMHFKRSAGRSSNCATLNLGCHARLGIMYFLRASHRPTRAGSCLLFSSCGFLDHPIVMQSPGSSDSVIFEQFFWFSFSTGFLFLVGDASLRWMFDFPAKSQTHRRLLTTAASVSELQSLFQE